MKTKVDRMEADLVAQSRVGNAAAFEELVRTHFKPVLKLCRRYARNIQEAEDLAQESFLLCYRGLRKVRGDNFRAWLYRIVVNVCLTNLRRRYREDRKIDRFREERARVDLPESDPDRRRELVRDRIDNLPGRQRDVLLLHLNGSLSHREIAEVLGITYDDVKTNLSLARRRLAEELARFLKE